MMLPSKGDVSKRLKRSKTVQGKVPDPHDASTMIEESVVWLTALSFYADDELTKPELEFLRVARRNLAKMHRRINRATS